MISIIYFLVIVCVIILFVVLLIRPQTIQSEFGAKRCPKCAARLFWRKLSPDAGEWACAACGCNSDEFSNKL
jgi:hypothetical protein